MDWYLEPNVTSVPALRSEIRAYLGRHADREEGLDEAELIVSELLNNGALHSDGPLWVTVRWSEQHPTLSVADLGAGFQLEPALPDDPSTVTGRGLFIVDELAESLDAATRSGDGTVVTATLPVHRAMSLSHDPPRRVSGALPALEEARVDGGFGKESFLRALVVQLAQTVEMLHGPEAAEAAIAQVGADVGGQMELEYRAARDVVERLTPEQVGECLVRLKHAIDGGFHLVEASAERLVLVNDRCPFGDSVRRAPALCRMTSSVFGGIAARSSDHGATVSLEERIAVGDACCRVVVWFDADPADAPAWGHRYWSSG